MRLNSTEQCLVCDMRDDHSTEECPYGDGMEPELGDPCDGCGEREDPAYPNRGDGWAEMGGPGYEDKHFIGHYQCGQARGLELA